MLDFEAVHKSIDQHWVANLAAIPTVFTNMDDVQLSEGSAPWVKQKVLPREAKQFELGNQNSARHWGVIVFIIYVRKGVGTLDRDRLYGQVVNSFRSQLIGGATFKDSQPMLSGSNENWFLSGYQIPFYFNSI